MENNYAKAYKEVIEILKFLPVESVNKIPSQMLEMFELKMDKNYHFEVDIYKSFEDQDLLDETKAIFANIFKDYWATDYQRERILAKEIYDREKLEEEKRKKYDVDLFKKSKSINSTNEEENNLPIEIKKENFYHRLINFIKNIFHLYK